MALACILLLPRAVSAERLPVSLYTAANGLPHDRVSCTFRDSRGFQWFCTAGGLSRFDGERFVNYGVAHGLSHPSINDLVEAADGNYWVATNGGGVCRFTPRARAGDPAASSVAAALFDCRAVGDGLANRVNVLLDDRRGRLWAGTDAGLFHLDLRTAGAFTPDPSGVPLGNVWAIAMDSAGDVWVGGNRGLARYGPGGRPRIYQVDPGRPSTVWALMVDREGRLWIGHDRGLLIVRPLPVVEGDPHPPLWHALLPPAAPPRAGVATLALPDTQGQARALTSSTGLVLERPGVLFQASDGHVWIGSERWAPGAPGLMEFDGHRLRAYTDAHGLGRDPIIAIAEDRGRNLWLATMTGGAMRLARGGLVAYGEADGLAPGRVDSVLAGAGRDFYVVTDGPRIHRFDGSRFAGVRPNIGSSASDGFYQVPLFDSRGEWWIPTDRGLYRFPRVSRLEDLADVRPTAVYGQRHGVPGDHVLRPFEDARGDLWFGVGGRHEVVRWERAAETFHVYGEREGLMRAGPPVAFREDRGGTLWIGFDRGAVARFRHGRFEVFRSAAGVPWGQIGTLHLDATGRLWIGSRDAALAYVPSDEWHAAKASRPHEAELARIDQPEADRPQIVLYPAEVLSGEGVRSIAEDGSGALYIGSDRGVQRFDPASGRIRRYTVADGLPSGDVEKAFVDKEGRLWFGTWNGIAQLRPTADAAAPPAMLISHVNVRGVPRPMSELGEAEMSHLALEADQNQLEIGFFALAFGSGRPLQYQYKLEGADDEWGPPVEERRVSYVSLTPGTYRFLVRALTSDGVVTAPAAVSFVILRPVWQRPWFIAVAVLTGLLLVAAAYRVRVARLLAVERMRTRIATDLHDDIGSSLSQIAILSEVIRQRHPNDAELGDPLGRIASTSREMVGAMNDIVWAIDPRRDSLTDLVQRMRRFATDVLDARGIGFAFNAPPDADQVRLGADVRRHVLLIFKEAVNNLARHSGATRAVVELSLDGHRLALQLTDDGRGFEPGSASRGHGLGSMRARAEAIGGVLEIVSAPASGTRLRLEIPLGRWAWRAGRSPAPRA